jgi:hypothetical protein
MSATFIGVRHHSPACARLTGRLIDELQPAYVLVEGPADLNGRIDELLLGHDLPVAVFTSYRDGDRRHASWAPFCAYSPEWVALTHGRAAGAELRFIDLPAWHPAFSGQANRYADAELRYADVMDRLCRSFDVDNVDVLWDHLFEIAGPDGLEQRLAVYFDLVRGEAEAGEPDRLREEYMAHWVRAALADAGDRPVVVVTGGFHRPALVRLVAAGGDADWPEAPRPPHDAASGSFLVPYSFRRLDSFDGYQSGMPSPAYYQDLFDGGPEAAARRLTESVAGRLRGRRQPVSTADLIAARATAGALATVRGNAYPARADVLDGLASALVNEALDVPLPWSARGTLRPGSHPVVVEMVAALSGNRVGRLHADTPAPPLLHHLNAELERTGLDRTDDLDLDLAADADRDRSRTLHRLRILGIPGFTRTRGPSTGVEPVLREHWQLRPGPARLTAIIEAGGYGTTLADASAAVLGERVADAGRDIDALATILFDAALAGTADISGRALADIEASVGAAPELGALGRTLAVMLTMWRHDRVLGTAHSTTLGVVIAAAVRRILWLAEGVRGGPAPADLGRIGALVACRDSLRHAGAALGLDRTTVLEVVTRIAADPGVPPDLRGAAFGFRWALPPDPAAPAPASAVPAPAAPAPASAAPASAARAVPGPAAPIAAGPGAAATAFDPVRAVRGAFVPASAGDWLAGLFALAREEVLHTEAVIGILDELVSALGADDFLIALPALRQAFEFFPPRERETLAERLLERRGLGGNARQLLRGTADPALVAAGLALDERVDAILTREGLVSR